VPRRSYSEAELEAAIEALGERDRFREAETLVTRAAPQLQSILAQALEAGGWFGESHDAEVLKAATTPDADERLNSVRTLLAEEARIGMMVGVAVGWALADELALERSPGGAGVPAADSGPGDAEPPPGDAERPPGDAEPPLGDGDTGSASAG
jgi:hypothetical protein